MTRDLLVEGTVVEALPHALFGIALDDGRRVLGHISGDLKYRWIRVLPGDRVEVELAPYDRTRGRIVGKRA